MIQHDLIQTAMAREIREIPLATERLLAQQDLVASVADRIRRADPRAVVISGRGSSANAGTLLRYLFEARAGLRLRPRIRFFVKRKDVGRGFFRLRRGAGGQSQAVRIDQAHTSRVSKSMRGSIQV